jgi:hypothetical protein
MATSGFGILKGRHVSKKARCYLRSWRAYSQPDLRTFGDKEKMFLDDRVLVELQSMHRAQ